MSARPIRIGTRGSALALWQTEWVRERLRIAGYDSVKVEIKTTGDVIQDVPSRGSARAPCSRSRSTRPCSRA